MAGKVSSDPNVFLLPDIGEGLQEAELIKWAVAEGDEVEENQTLAEVETDKALSEIPSPRAGVIAKLHGAPGDMMQVGAPFVSYQGDGSAAPAPTKSADNGAAAKGARKAPAEAAEEREDAGTVVGQMGGALRGVSAEGGKALATPAVRRLARDLGVDIDTVVGGGIGGRVLEKDVRAAAEGGGRAARAPQARRAPAPAEYEAPRPVPAARRDIPAIPAGEQTQRIPFRGVRRTIAGRLRESVDTAVHFTVMDEADTSALDALRRRLGAASGEKVSFLPFVASAVCRALTREFPDFNSTVEEDGEQAEIVRHRAVHLGIAADTDSGLMVPVIRDCDALGVLEISREVARIASAARDRSIPREQLIGSTFTISNVGSHAGRFATPIINYPEVAILAVGRGREGMVVRDGWFRVGKLLPLSLACDHRVVDGATAALLLARIIELLEAPDQLLEPARGG
ncbi:MAG: dihydrolipoamide acetyltransferase family protein [Phycisphaerales bacterium JB039]